MSTYNSVINICGGFKNNTLKDIHILICKTFLTRFLTSQLLLKIYEMERKQLEKFRGGIKQKGDNELDYDPSRIPGINMFLNLDGELTF